MLASFEGTTCEVWCMGRTIDDMSRIWRGPWRGPGRLVVPPSHGMPTRPMSMPLASSSGTCGMRMKVAMAPKRGVTSPDRGLLNSSMM